MLKLKETYFKEDTGLASLAGIKSTEDLSQKLKQMPREEVQTIQDEINKINQKYKSQFSGMVTLYHGTTNAIAEKIKKSGFKLTQGVRSGFLGSEKNIKNQAIFLSDDKSLARAYGANRDPHEGRDAQVLEVKADIKNTLDMTKWGSQIPLEIRKMALKILSDYEGKKIRKPAQEDMYWMIDQPEIVQVIKDEGYDSIRFSESRTTKKTLDIMGSGDTIAVFDPSKLHIMDLPIKGGLKGVIDYLQIIHPISS